MKGNDHFPNLSPQTTLSRRDLLGFAARGAASVVVSQALLGCTTRASTTADGSTTAAAAGSTSCVLTAALTEGPFFVDEKFNRSDIRSDPPSGIVAAGSPLAVTFNVSRIDGSACTPLTGAFVDVWHCDAAGVYSDVAGNSRKFLRGYQVTDASGIARFTTAYPGWYSGRAVHIHFKLRLFAGAAKTYEFTSQFFFDEALTDSVHARAPYVERGKRDVVNTTDGTYNRLSAAERTGLTLQTTSDGSGYAGVINLGVKVG